MICHDLNSELPGLIDHWNDAVSDLCGIENSEHGPFDKSKLDKFLSSYLLDTGWMEVSEIVFANGSEERYYHIHPMLTNQLRRALLAGRYSSNWPSNLYRTHAHYTGLWLRNTNIVSQGMSQLYQVKAEYLSLLAACDTQLAWCSQEQPLGFPEKARRSAQLMAYQICRVMIALSKKLQVPSFAMDPAYTRLGALTDHLSANIGELVSLSWFEYDLTTSDMLMELYLLLCDYRAKYNPIQAGVIASTCLVIIMAVCKEARWSPLSRLLLAKLLLFRAHGCYLARTRSAEARQAFEMAIRCRFQESSLKSVLAATFLRKSPFEALKTTAREMLASETSPCSPAIYSEVCEHRLAAFLGLLQTAKDLTLFYGEADQDLILRRPIILESFRILNLSANLRNKRNSDAETAFPDVSFPMQSLRKWIHGVVDDDVIGVKGPEPARNNDIHGEMRGLPINPGYRAELMSEIDQAMQDQDRLVEIERRRELVQMAVEDHNWEAAAGHILRIVDIERARSGLPNLDARKTIKDKMLHDSPGPPLEPKEGNLRQQQFEAALYGSVFLRLDDFEHAFFFFGYLRLLRVGNVHAPASFCTSWEQLVDRLLDDGRVGIFILSSPSIVNLRKGRQSLISEQAEELDGLMQAMIIRCVEDKSLKAGQDFQDSDRPKLHAMVKSPFEWKDARIATFCELGLVHLMLHFENLIHIDPQAVEQRQIKDWLAAYPREELDLSPLEDGVPLSPVDPEGLYKGPLKHVLRSYKDLKDTQEVIDHIGVRDASPEQMKLVISLFPKGMI